MGDTKTKSGIVDRVAKLSPVVVFSKSACSYCEEAVDLLRELDARFMTVELDKVKNGKAMHEMLKKETSWQTLPAIYIGGEFIGGCEDGPSDGKGLMTLYAKGQLIPLLKEAGAFINQNMYSPGRKEEPVG
mmetsp:Transcript_3442/g.6585  ORF Transcript_3442/g.6585 Transcript_3442/m.6585 type:complete len:131 (-) Transcript_3442:384-776(-)